MRHTAGECRKVIFAVRVARQVSFHLYAPVEFALQKVTFIEENWHAKAAVVSRESLRKKSNIRMRLHCCSNGDFVIASHKVNESCKRLTFRSSARRSSKTEIGARKRMTCTSEKYGTHARR